MAPGYHNTLQRNLDQLYCYLINCQMHWFRWRYCIVGKLGWGKVWRIYSLWVFGKKVWQMKRFSQKVIIINRNLDSLVCQIKDDLPNFLPAKHSRYTVMGVNTTHTCISNSAVSIFNGDFFIKEHQSIALANFEATC